MSEWKTIESAPKNTSVLVFASRQMFVAWFQDDATDPYHEDDEGASDFNGLWCVTDNKHGPYSLRGGLPSHWAPLPGPPQ